jgi:hypothetical protein
LLKINAVFGVDVQLFSEDDEARLVADVREVLDAVAARLGDDGSAAAPPLMPFEQVRDFFYARHNHIAALDEAASRFTATPSLLPAPSMPA